MAWIKVRTCLPTHPKVVTLASRLGVTRSNVVGALCCLWSVADDHADFEGDDGRIACMSPEALDSIVELPGFCAELEKLGWVVHEDQTLVLPRFTEHNGSTAKSRAQSQKRKEKSRCHAPVTVERDTTVTRGEERREEKKREESPPTPPRGESERGRTKKAKPAKFDPATISLPASLDTPEFRAAWADFALHRQGLKKTLTGLAAGRVLKKLEPYGAATAAQAIDDAIAGSWQGVFPDKAAGGLQRPHTGNADQPSPDGFDDFWLAYPDFKRTNQPAARREWGPSVARAGGAEIIIERVRAYAKAVARWPEEDRRFVPAPASWLEGDRWGDDPASWKRKGAGSGPSTGPPSNGYHLRLPSFDELPPVEDRRKFIASARAAIGSRSNGCATAERGANE